jgi:hypothetical protein
MTIGRPQIFKQIKGYQAGGIADLEVDTQPLLPPLGGSLPPAMPNNVLPLNNSLPAAPETPVLATETPVLATDASAGYRHWKHRCSDSNADETARTKRL